MFYKKRWSAQFSLPSEIYIVLVMINRIFLFVIVYFISEYCESFSLIMIILNFFPRFSHFYF